MGNFSINHYSKIEVENGAMNLRYIIDMAEIPTFQELGEVDANRDKINSPEEEKAYLSRKVEELKKGLSLELNGEPLHLLTGSSGMVFIPGAGGLPTVKMAIEYKAKIEEDALLELNRVLYRDNNYAGRAGWKEVIVLGGEGVSLVSSTAPPKKT